LREIHSTYRFIFCIAILLLSVNNVHAQNLKVAIDKKNILIGEQVTIDFFIQHNKGEPVQVTIPDSINHFEIINKKGLDTTLENGINVLQQKIIFTSFDSGKWAFPPINYTVNNIAGNTDSVEINVGYMPIDSSAAPRDIKTVLEVDYFNWMWVWLAVVILLVSIIGYIIYKYLRKKYYLPEGKERVDAYKEAMAALSILQKENEENTLSVKEYHTKLTNVFKNYCGRITFQNFFNFTTKEVLAKLKTYEINVQTSSEATEALQTGDATKFAKYHPSFVENEAALNFIKNTITEIEKSRTKNT
jgi:heme exporter protein D